MNRQQQAVIEYLEEEIRVLREQLGKPLQFDDRQRRRLAAKGKAVGRRRLERLTNLVTPDTLLAWYRRLGGTCQGRRNARTLRSGGGGRQPVCEIVSGWHQASLRAFKGGDAGL